jgi:DNA-binding transcriptional MerR regulator
MSEQILYGLCELARELNLPESTTRYYRDVFAPYVPSVGMGRKRRYPVDALTTLRFIANAFAAGKTRDEIRVALNNGSAPPRDTHEETEPQFSSTPLASKQDRVMASIIEGDREQRELMWQMIRELSRFGDAIERQHYILSELVEHVFHDADRQLRAACSEHEIEPVVDAEIVMEGEGKATERKLDESRPSHDDVEALRRALETERDLVNRLRQSKLELERRAAAAEAELEHTQEQEPGLLRRLFERGNGR